MAATFRALLATKDGDRPGFSFSLWVLTLAIRPKRDADR